MWSFKNVYLVSSKKKIVSDGEVDVAEAQLGTNFPTNYREYVTILGDGEFCGFVSIYSPSHVVKSLAEYRTLFEDHADFWPDGLSILPAERLVECIVIGASIDGDLIAFHPDHPNTLYELPRHDSSIYKIGSTMYEALDWYRLERLKNKPPRFFDSRIGRKTYTPYDVSLSYHEFKDWLLGLGAHNLINERHIPDVPPPAVATALIQGGKVVIAGQSDEYSLDAFYRCFSGYVSCFTDIFGRLIIQVRYDPEEDDGTAQSIISFLQSKRVQPRRTSG